MMCTIIQMEKASLCQGIGVCHWNAFSKILQRVKNLEQLICCCQRHLVEFIGFVYSFRIWSQVSSTFHPKTAAILIFMKPRFWVTGDLDPDLQRLKQRPFFSFILTFQVACMQGFLSFFSRQKRENGKFPGCPHRVSSVCTTWRSGTSFLWAMILSNWPCVLLVEWSVHASIELQNEGMIRLVQIYISN